LLSLQLEHIGHSCQCCNSGAPRTAEIATNTRDLRREEPHAGAEFLQGLYRAPLCPQAEETESRDEANTVLALTAQETPGRPASGDTSLASLLHQEFLAQDRRHVLHEGRGEHPPEHFSGGALRRTERCSAG